MKTNLIIDVSFFFRRSLNATDYTNYLKKDEKILDNERTQAIFIRKTAMDLAYQIKKFTDLNISRVILCTDSNSWRSDFYIEYKGTRTKEDIVNWDMYYKLYDDLCNLLVTKGCVLTNIKGLEGDDLIYYYTCLFKKTDNLNIVISSDNDLKQLVNTNTIIHNVITNKTTISNKFKLQTTDDSKVNILDMKDDSFTITKTLNILKSLLQDANIIDPLSIVFSKTILGDKSDNIPNLISMFGTKKVENIILKNTDKVLNIEYLNTLLTLDGCKDLFELMKIEKKSIIWDEIIVEQIKKNLTLTWLNNSIIPKEYSIAFKNWLLDNKDKLNNRANVHELSSMNDILEGTDYINRDDYESDDSIFDAINFDQLSANYK